MKKGIFLRSFFRNISKTAEIILIKKKKISRNHNVSVYKKALMSVNIANFFFFYEILIDYFVKMSCTIPRIYRYQCYSKTSVKIKTKLYGDYELIRFWLKSNQKLRGEGLLKN